MKKVPEYADLKDKDELEYKLSEVKILDFKVVMIPVMSGVGQQKNITVIWGLGNDNELYQWDSKLRKWVC